MMRIHCIEELNNLLCIYDKIHKDKLGKRQNGTN